MVIQSVTTHFRNLDFFFLHASPTLAYLFMRRVQKLAGFWQAPFFSGSDSIFWISLGYDLNYSTGITSRINENEYYLLPLFYLTCILSSKCILKSNKIPINLIKFITFKYIYILGIIEISVFSDGSSTMVPSVAIKYLTLAIVCFFLFIFSSLLTRLVVTIILWNWRIQLLVNQILFLLVISGITLIQIVTIEIVYSLSN